VKTRAVRRAPPRSVGGWVAVVLVIQTATAPLGNAAEVTHFEEHYRLFAPEGWVLFDHPGRGFQFNPPGGPPWNVTLSVIVFANQSARNETQWLLGAVGGRCRYYQSEWFLNVTVAPRPAASASRPAAECVVECMRQACFKDRIRIAFFASEHWKDVYAVELRENISYNHAAQYEEAVRTFAVEGEPPPPPWPALVVVACLAGLTVLVIARRRKARGPE
jgi:hypothetical protein